MNTEKSSLTSFGFLLALVLLLLNDFVFKYSFGNWWTGKLSDFAGLFVFTVFFATIFPKFRTTVFLITVLGFVYWKSPYSQGIIDLWNGLPFYNINRVVDYTDFIAFLILPFAYRFVSDHKTRRRYIPIRPIFPIVLTIFAISATSIMPGTDFRNNPVTYSFDVESKEEFINKLQEAKIDIELSYLVKEGEVWTMKNLNDSIVSLSLLVVESNAENKVEVSLEHWGNNSIQHNQQIKGKEQKRQQELVKSIFERLVLPLFERT